MGRVKEYSIMPQSCFYSTERFPGSERHEVFFGEGRRQKSIKLGLVVFLSQENHTGPKGVHFNSVYDWHLKKLGQKAAMKKYGWSKDDFIREFGKSYLED